ncbi:metallophosphoesterase [Amycolatopsis sp. NPDC059657]|uniref:metallophosphoesterase n=1 Tax=Amycolatopsis sp. NPDC059657 TaxID=3346899 RepID=UPI003672EBBB
MRLPVLLVVLALLFGLPWWTLVLAPGVLVLPGTIVFMAALLLFPLMMYLGHSRRALDRAARIGDTMLGVIWVFFAWSALGQLLHVFFDSSTVALVVLVISVVLVLWGTFEAMRVPRIKRVDVIIPRLGAGLDGVKVALISDTHLGPLNRARWMAKVVAVVNDLDPDIAIHAGDIADGSVARRTPQAAPLADVRARLAKVYATGNHEYFGEAQAWLDHMETLGWEPLHNRHLVVERDGAKLVLAGVDDRTAAASRLPGHGADLPRALSGADESLPVLLVAHQPKQITDAVSAGVDLQVSGHTHGGQIWPFHYLVRIDQPSVHGLTKHGDRTQLYTTRGTGFWGPPLRVFAPSEITLLTLKGS